MRQLIETARVTALHSYSVLGSPAGQFDAVCNAAVIALDTTAASVSFLDAEREWVKGRHGADLPDEPRHLSFCHHTIHELSGVLVVPDLLADARFSAHPSVQSGAMHRSYAGVSIVDPGDYRIGTVAVLDRRRRQFGTDSVQALRHLADAVMDTLLPVWAAMEPVAPLMPALEPPAPPAPPEVLVQGWLGVRTERALQSLTAPTGLRLLSVASGGPADRAGLAPGDVLFAVAEHETRESGDVTRALAARQVGEAVPVHVWRSGVAVQRTVHIEPMPEGQRPRRRSSVSLSGTP